MITSIVTDCLRSWTNFERQLHLEWEENMKHHTLYHICTLYRHLETSKISAEHRETISVFVWPSCCTAEPFVNIYCPPSKFRIFIAIVKREREGPLPMIYKDIFCEREILSLSFLVWRHRHGAGRGNLLHARQ